MHVRNALEAFRQAGAHLAFADVPVAARGRAALSAAPAGDLPTSLCAFRIDFARICHYDAPKWSKVVGSGET